MLGPRRVGLTINTVNQFVLKRIYQSSQGNASGVINGYPWCPATIWERDVAECMQVNPEVSELFFRGLGEITVMDWPDREDVYRNPIWFAGLVERRWTFEEGTH